MFLDGRQEVGIIIIKELSENSEKPWEIVQIH